MSRVDKQLEKLPIASPTGNVHEMFCPECRTDLVFDFTCDKDVIKIDLETVVKAMDMLNIFSDGWKSDYVKRFMAE